MQARFATAVLLGFVLIGAAACGGGDGSIETADPGGSPLTYDGLTAGQVVPPGTYHIVGAPDELLEELDEVEQPDGGYAPGSEITVAGVGLRCTSDSPTNCSVTLHDDDSFTTTGTIAIVEAGDTFPMTAAERLIAEANARADQAEKDARQAEQDAADAEEAKEDAEEALQEEEEARLAAEADARQLENEAEERRKADATERARTAIAGHTATTGALSPLAVNTNAIEYGEPAPVTNPQGPFSTSMGRSGSWSTTSLTRIAEPERDIIQIYSDVEADTREPFRTSPLNERTGTPTVVIDGTGDVVAWVDIENATGGDDNHSRIAASGSFPREIGDPKPFSLVDRGLTEGAYTALNLAADGSADDTALENAGITRQQYNRYRTGSPSVFRDESDFPQRYAYTTSGTLQGAGGLYRCSGADTTATCTVQNRGGSFNFAGTNADWDFIPSSGSVQIVVPDAEYMWFGVWARQTVRLAAPPAQPTELWRFDARHGGTHAVSDLSAATGSATYTGPAAGRYAVYEPDTGDSGIGSFTASATLQADFDTSPNTVSGSITNFSNDPSWSLALKRKDITGGATPAVVAGEDTVTWTIDGVPDDSGSWEAQFYNNLPATTVTYQPHGIAGTFEAAYDPSDVGARAAVIGGFGAHR